MAHTNTAAEAVNTLEWLSTTDTTLVVPVYQRRYRWGIGSCEQLLADIHTIAVRPDLQTHFFGSILQTPSSMSGITERMLVDGQQRVTTVMLLITAIRDSLIASGESLPEDLLDVLLHPTQPGRTRLTLHKQDANEFTSIVVGPTLPETEAPTSNLRDNYEYFREKVDADALIVWQGLQRFEHVAITLLKHSLPQQVFESLNSTGIPLSNHELIHNYLLMGLTNSQQMEIEETYWIPIETNTGTALDSFWRDYLILATGQDTKFDGDRGIYEVFKSTFPGARYADVIRDAPEWKAHSEIYRTLLHPDQLDDVEIGQNLGYLNIYGTALYPLLLGVFRDYQLNTINRDVLLELLHQVQSLYLRKMVVGESRDHLAAQLCRRKQKHGYPIPTIIQRTPTDERIRQALQYRSLPHASHVLTRIYESTDPTGLGDRSDLQIEHIFPQNPTRSWSPDGTRVWSNFSEADRAKYREILSTIGNLTLLEQPLNIRAANKPFPKKTQYYLGSAIPANLKLAKLPSWDLASISDRTENLTKCFLGIWQRPMVEVGADADDLLGLTPVLDAQRKPGWYPGWRTEFQYVVFEGKIWEEHNVKDFYRRVFTNLWNTREADVLAYSAENQGPVYPSEQWSGQWQQLGAHYLFMGYFPQYMLAEVQNLLDHVNLADRVYVRYSTTDD